MNVASTSESGSSNRAAKVNAVVQAASSRKASSKAAATKKAIKPTGKAQSTQASKAKQSLPVKTKVAESKKPALVEKSAPKVKLIRDSFTLPEADHDLIKQCKKAAIAGGRETKKSEVVRAAIRAFSAMSVSAQLSAYSRLQPIAVGRPKAK